MSPSPRVQAELVARATAAVKEHAAPWYSTSAQEGPAVEVLSSEARDGATVLRLLTHHYNYEFAQSGSDWADHYVLAGRAVVVDDVVTEATFELVRHVHLTERESDHYAPSDTVDAVRAAPATPRRAPG
jgi:hypothetical protein